MVLSTAPRRRAMMGVMTVLGNANRGGRSNSFWIYSRVWSHDRGGSCNQGGSHNRVRVSITGVQGHNRGGSSSGWES